MSRVILGAAFGMLAGFTTLAGQPFDVRPRSFDVRPAPPRWPSPLPMPDGARPLRRAVWTQSIFSVLGEGAAIKRVPVASLERKWQVSGGMEGIRGVTSHKYATLPRPPRTWAGPIAVHNGRNLQDNIGLKRSYPAGSRFDDILTYRGRVFEHRARTKDADGWRSRVLWSDRSARPPGYAGLSVTCASCHDEAGTGKYDAGLVPGGDTVLSDPLDWSKAGRMLRR
jgi:hypothetical protein